MSEQKTRPAGTQREESAGTEKANPVKPAADSKKSGEVGGPKGPEPTRFGDWERNGRCVDF